MGGIRQQFCTAVTVQMVQFSIKLWTVFDEQMGTPSSRPRAWFRQRGYLFLADAASAASLMKRYEEERRAGAHVQMLSVQDLRDLLPDVHLDDIVFGMLGPDDGYANPREVLAGFRGAAETSVIEYRSDEVIDISREGSRVSGVELASGTHISTPLVVNAAGAWAGRLAALAGLHVPVEPMRQVL